MAGSAGGLTAEVEGFVYERHPKCKRRFTRRKHGQPVNKEARAKTNGALTQKKRRCSVETGWLFAVIEPGGRREIHPAKSLPKGGTK